jgi:hypothetical protein
MEIMELSIRWRDGSGVWRLRLGDGKPRLTPDAGDKEGRRGSAWSEEEEEAIRASFAAGDSVPDLAERLGRSAGAVRARLVRLGLLSEEEAGLRYPVKVG